MLRIFLLCFLLCTSAGVHARMYQWIDSDSGSTQLSGKPPTWYRTSESGPRIFVFDKGRIIDDTDIKVSDVERDRLRQQAFLKAEEERAVAREKLLQARRLKASIDQQKEMEEGLLVDVDLDETQGMETSDDTVTDTLVDTQDLTSDDMRNLISEWERQRTENAKELIRTTP